MNEFDNHFILHIYYPFSWSLRTHILPMFWRFFILKGAFLEKNHPKRSKSGVLNA